jgi:hypothetical protein
MVAASSNRPMKFWEVVSGFRSCPSIVRSVLSTEQWRESYWQNYVAFESLVNEQRREILDQPVPLELTKQICAQWPDQFVLSLVDFTLRQSHVISTSIEQITPMTMLSALDVHERFGPAVIEEIFEYGSANVGPGI